MARRSLKTVICKVCGREFSTRTNRKTCSKECAATLRPTNSKDSLCWECSKATAGSDCPWANEFKPVDGWLATPTKILDSRRKPKIVIESFDDKYCPLFDR